MKTKFGDTTTYAPEDSTTVATFKEPTDDVKTKIGDTTSSNSHKTDIKPPTSVTHTPKDPTWTHITGLLRLTSSQTLVLP